MSMRCSFRSKDVTEERSREMKKQKLLACLTALCMTVTAFAPIAQPVQAQTDVETAEASSTLNVIPKPSEYTMNEGTFTLGADAEIAVIAEDDGVAAELTNTGEYIAEVFRVSTGYELPVVEKNRSGEWRYHPSSESGWRICRAGICDRCHHRSGHHRSRRACRHLLWCADAETDASCRH